MRYFMYNLHCADGSYYVGHTDNLRQRLKYHNEGRGPVYTANRRPVRMVLFERHPSLEDALKRERQIKGWTHAKKEALIGAHLKRLHDLARRRN